MEEVECAICESGTKDLVYEVRDRLHGIDGIYRLVRCHGCGLLYLSPRPDRTEIGRYYPSDYEPYSDTENRSFLRRIDVAFGVGKRCRAVTREKAHGRILDVGCASGRFLSRMKDQGWDVRGVDVSEYAAHKARELHGIDVFCGEVQEAKFEQDSFDVVTLWDVLEHLHSPRNALSEVKRLLKRDGVLIMSTPDVSSLDSRLFGQYWAGLDAPRHLCLFSPRTSSLLLRQLGFEIIDRRYFTGNHFTFVQSLRFLINEKGASSALSRVARSIVDSHVFRAALIPYGVTLNRVMRGPVMTLFARKNEG